MKLDGSLQQGASIAVAAGRTLDWHNAGYGELVAAVEHIYAVREVIAIGGSGELGLDGAMPAWANLREVAYRLLSSAAFLPGCDALEVRYVADPAPGRATQLRMFITAKTVSGARAAAESAVQTACAALPTSFVSQPPVDGPAFGPGRPQDGRMIIELRRLEQITEPQWTFVPADYYYAVDDDPGDGSGWAAFWAAFAAVQRPVEISFAFRATELDSTERHALGAVTTALELFASPRTDIDHFGNQAHFPADANAAIALESWKRRIAQLQRALLGRVAVRGEPLVASAMASALATAIGASQDPDGKGHTMDLCAPGFRPRDVALAAEAFDCVEVFPWGGPQLEDGRFFWDLDEAPHTLRRMPYLFGLKEAAGLAVLPVPDEQGAPGFERARRTAGRRSTVTRAGQEGPLVALGQVVHQGAPAGPIGVPLRALLRHTLVIGASGSGKTTTVLSLLADLWREHRVPFLVIEPIKTEYRSLLATDGLDELQVITLGRDDLSPLRLNPLEPPPGVRCEAHASAVMASFKLALPLTAPLPQLLEAAVDRAYRMAGWDYDTTVEDGRTPPTLRGLMTAFDVVFEQAGYVGEAHNVSAAMRVRLQSLLQGARGRVFDTVESVDFATLLQRPVVIELDELADPEDKAIVSALLLDRVRAQARARGAAGGRLQHVTVIEEAHRLLARADEGQRDTAGGGNARGDAVRAFCEAIRELRALGEGFILSSQRPADLAMAAVATTSTKVMHRLETAVDRRDVLDDLDAGALDREAAARLRAGEAIVRISDQDEAELVVVQPAAGVDSGRRTDDASVARHMRDATDQTRRLLPYALCSRAVCRGGCEPEVRGEGRLLAEDVARRARAAWSAADGSADALEPIATLLVREADRDVQLAYCGAAHLGAGGDAFVLRRRRDIRPMIIDAIGKAAGER